MKISGRLLGMVLIVMAITGTVFASDFEKGRKSGYESRERYENEFRGTIERLPPGLIGTWTVSGRQFEVVKDTLIRQEYGKARIGAYVEVKGRNYGGIFRAHEIEVKKAGR